MSEPQGGYASPQPTPPSGNAQVYRVTLSEVTSFLLMMERKSTTHTGTLEQLEAAARYTRVHNLVGGWWGIGLLANAIALAQNAKRMRQVRELARRLPGS